MRKIILLLTVLVLFTFKNQAQTINDIDGNFYDTIRIGTQVWLQQNLKVTHYRNGDLIENVEDAGAWDQLTTGARCYYNNDSALNASVYGALYNIFTIEDSRGLCPLGWHVPTDAEWNIMEKFLDPTIDTNATGWVGNDIGGKLKETGIIHWNTPNTGAVNSSDFTALPGGYRDIIGTYSAMGQSGYWWSSTEYSSLDNWGRSISYYYSLIARDDYSKENGFSVRCVKDNSTSQVEENDIDHYINAYPNPADDNLTVNFNATERNPDRIVITDIYGKQVYNEPFNAKAGNLIYVSDLANGNYILQLRDRDGIVALKKIIVMH